MKRKYKEFVGKFEELCEEYVAEDFDVEEVKEACNEVIDRYGE